MTPLAMAGRLLPVLAVLLLSLPAAADTLQGRVVRVVDGDTVVVLTDKVQHKIRLMGIDAPERKQAYGSVSTKYLSELVAGKTVVVEYRKRDRYGRIAGKILVDGQNANLDQVRAGLDRH